MTKRTSHAITPEIANELTTTDPATLKRLKKVHDRIKTYSDVTGISLSEVVANALEEWMEVTGDLHLETLSRRAASGKLLPWPN